MRLDSLRKATITPLLSEFNLESEDKATLISSFGGKDTAAILTGIRETLTGIIDRRNGYTTKLATINEEIN